MKRSVSHILIVLVGTLSACAGKLPGESPRAPQEVAMARPGPSAPALPAEPARSPEESLRARATQFWEARVKDDVATQYAFLESKGRKQVTLTGYVLSHNGIAFKSYQLQEVVVDGDWGQVKASATYHLRMPKLSRFGPWTHEATTYWVREGGGWYLKFDQLEDAERLKRTGQGQP